MIPLQDLGIQIFADGADMAGITAMYANPLIKGMTTNPTLMKKAGIKDYEAFAREVLAVVKDKPISFEVFSDDFDEMRRQALKIRDWQSNVYVKIPITNTRGESSIPLVRELAAEGVKVNVTAVLTLGQVERVAGVLSADVPSVVSIFAGRIADTGVDPVPTVQRACEMLSALPKCEVLWASVREILNIRHAAASGCHIVTVPHDILTKALKMDLMNLEQLSLETVKMFEGDARSSGFTL